MPQHIETDPASAWTSVDPGYPDPVFQGSSILSRPDDFQPSHFIQRESLDDSSSILSMQIQSQHYTSVAVGLVGSSPSPGVAVNAIEEFRASDLRTYYGISWALSGGNMLPSQPPSTSFGLWPSSIIYPLFQEFGSLAPGPLGEEYEALHNAVISAISRWRLDVFFKKTAQQSAAVMTGPGIRCVTGWQDIVGVSDWGAYCIFFQGGSVYVTFPPPDGLCTISQMRIQYGLTDEEVDASYNAAIGGGTVGAGGEVTGGPIGDDGLPGRPGGIPGVTLLSGSQIIPESTAKVSHVRILRGERTPAQAKSFHHFLKGKA